MRTELMEEIEDYMEELNADSYQKGKGWKGYDVYIPEYKQLVYIGLPYVVLVRGEEVRLSTEEESLEYLEYSEKEEALGKDLGDLKSEQMGKLD